MMLSIVVPTLGQREEAFKRLLASLHEQTNTSFELIVVSQDNHADVNFWLKDHPFQTNHIKMSEKGLSKARNKAWSFIQGDLVTFSDDDCWYPKHAVASVHECLANGSDGFCFQIYDPHLNESYKNYPRTGSTEVKGRMLFRKSSIELFFRSDSIKSLRFHEAFGLGGRYPSGEENLFIKQFINSGKQLSYYPEVIVYHEKPTQQSRLSESQLISKGPLFKEMYNAPFAFLLLSALFLKKAKDIKNPAKSYTKAVKALINSNEKVEL